MGNYFWVSKLIVGWGGGGRLTLFWKQDVELDVESSSLNHIDALINKGREDT